MVDKNLVGRCGLYCGACIIYRAGKDSKRLQRVIAERENCGSEDIRCEGCQTVLTNGWDVKGEEWVKKCKIVMCLEAKRLDFCYECSEYPDCKKFREITDSCLKLGENLIENLEKIKRGKVVEWLEEEDKKWKCQKCIKPIAMHLTECHWCGTKKQQ